MNHSEKISVIEGLFLKIQPNDISGVLQDILTPAEIDEIADRICILKLLRSGMSQRDIAQELGISVTTISRGSRVLQYGEKIIEKYI